MSIQISVVVWTVICFFLLMLILKNLLFKPMLTMIDSRNARIKNAHIKKEAADNDAKQRKIAMEQQQRDEYEQAAGKAKSDIAAAREKAEKLIAEEHGKKQSVLNDYLSKLAAERSAICESLNEKVGELADVFVSGFLN